MAVQAVGGEDAGEIIGQGVRRPPSQPLVQRLDGAQGHEFGNPGIAELESVRHGIAGIGGEQFFVRRAPGDLLRAHPDAGMAALEFRQQRLDLLAFLTHSPEFHDGRPVGGIAAGETEGEDEAEQAQAK